MKDLELSSEANKNNQNEIIQKTQSCGQKCNRSRKKTTNKFQKHRLETVDLIVRNEDSFYHPISNLKHRDSQYLSSFCENYCQSSENLKECKLRNLSKNDSFAEFMNEFQYIRNNVSEWDSYIC